MMRQKQLIIIEDELPQFRDFFRYLEEHLPYEVLILETDDLFKGQISQQVKAMRINDTLLAIDSGIFRQNEKKIRKYFRQIFQGPFLNVLKLSTNLTAFQDTLRQNLQDNFFILYPDLTIDKNATFFQLHCRELYAKATLSSRLSDYIYDSFKEVVYSEMLKQKKVEIERLNQELEHRNRIDPLTNLFNRRALFEYLEKERNRTARNLLKIGTNPSGPVSRLPAGEERRAFSPDFIAGNLILFSILMIDLDKFKEVNDTYGHLAGDVVLRTVGNIFRNSHILREQDVVGRFGGEEFIVILPGTTAENALQPARRLAEELAKQSFADTSGRHFRVTMSVGISEYNINDPSGDAIIQRADKALYEAKESGRNRIVVYRPGTPA